GGLTGGGGGLGTPEAGSGGTLDEGAPSGSTLFGGRSPALVAWPSPYRDGNLSIAYADDGTGGRRGGGDILIYDLAGRLVRGLSSTPYAQGYRIATWDGRDAQGGKVAGGMYFIRTGSPGEERLIRLAVVR
ncbi:MAG TPA: FlgD immunoglobulin-like domain containing protein, partial [Candidatus Eisenbacteria bacterium]